MCSSDLITSQFGTVDMWDWELITYMREAGMTVFSPYNVELGRVIFRAFAVRAKLRGARFLMFQDDPGEGMQPNIFKKFYWWEKEATQTMHDTFGMNLIYKSWKKLAAEAKAVAHVDKREAQGRQEVQAILLHEACGHGCRLRRRNCGQTKLRQGRKGQGRRNQAFRHNLLNLPENPF